MGMIFFFFFLLFVLFTDYLDIFTIVLKVLSNQVAIALENFGGGCRRNCNICKHVQQVLRLPQCGELFCWEEKEGPIQVTL